jgi:hypothetical protein
VQWRATVVAAFLRRIVQTQPAPSRNALRIQTLHRSTCQIQHRSLDLRVDACEYVKKCVTGSGELKIVQRGATRTEIFA